MNEHPQRNESLTYVRFAISGQVFMMLGFLGMMATYLFQHRLFKFAILGSLWLGFVLVFIGMIVGMKYVFFIHQFSMLMVMTLLPQHGG